MYETVTDNTKALTTGEMCSLTSMASSPRLLPPWPLRIFRIRLAIGIGRRRRFRLMVRGRSIALGPLMLSRINHILGKDVVLVGVVKVELVGRRGFVHQGGRHIYLLGSPGNEKPTLGCSTHTTVMIYSALGRN